MTNRNNITSASPFEESIGFSRAVRIGNFIAVSGTAPIPSKGDAPTTVYDQTRLCLQIMHTVIEKAGGTLAGVIRTRIMLTDISRWKEAAQAHGELFSLIRPACTFVEVKGFIDPTWLVEIEADCIVELE
ncbi:RidA family protein [Scytonema sp. NUACC26]|uniref:RidA family protein n=1 Tax=Scytonema sp. NUACC26 TaxID=3140176 RepID=UPI0034DB8B8C